MKKFPTGMFIAILILTLVAFVINIPKQFALKVPFPKPNTEIKGANPVLHFLKIPRDFSFRRGLDLEGGTSITLKADMAGIPGSQRDNALDSAREVIERRVNFFGVSEPIVQTVKTGQDYRINVELPGVTDINEAVRLVGRTAKLTFWEPGNIAPGTESASEAAKFATPSAAMPLGIRQFLGVDAKKTNLSGADLKEAQVVFDNRTGKPQVQLAFTNTGGKKFAEITKRNVGKRIAMVLDDVVVEAPMVQTPILDGNAVIQGDFTTQTAKALQVQLNAGALPVSLSVLEQHAIGSTLGEASLKKSFIAGIIGFFVIVLFMTVLYGRLGVVASLALGIYTLLVLALFRLIPVTLTLAGIAGLILSIGIAVDANILIFERMREEIRKGKSRESALTLGFNRAWPSIRDSNIASLITSGILYYFGTGMIRGFALTLAIGILVSMFSAIVVTRTFLRILYRR